MSKKRDGDKSKPIQTAVSYLEQYKWVDPPISEDKAVKHYPSIFIKTASEKFRVVVGDTVLFCSSGTQAPFVAIIEDLYEDKSTGYKSVTARWFFRPNDVILSAPSALDKIKVEKHEIFYSPYTDENQVQSILSVCKVHYFDSLDSPKSVIMDTTFSGDQFICRYKYESSVGVVPLKKNELQRLIGGDSSKKKPPYTRQSDKDDKGGEAKQQSNQSASEKEKYQEGGKRKINDNSKDAPTTKKTKVES